MLFAFMGEPDRDDLIDFCEKLPYGIKKLFPVMSRVSFAELYANMDKRNQLFFKVFAKMLCGKDYSVCDKLYLKNYNVEGKGCQFTKPEEVKQYTLTRWIKSIIDPVTYGQKRVFVKLFPKKPVSDLNTTNNKPQTSSSLYKLGADYSDMLSPPPGYSADINKIREILNDNTLSDEQKSGYFMRVINAEGAYGGEKRSYILMELRDSSQLKLYGEDIAKFVKGYAVPKYEFLNQLSDETMEKFDVLANTENELYYEERKIKAMDAMLKEMLEDKQVIDDGNKIEEKELIVFV